MGLLVRVAADCARRRTLDIWAAKLNYLDQPGGDIWCGMCGLSFCPAGGHCGTSWALQRFLFRFLYADDLQLMAGGARKYDRVWFVIWLMMGTPFKWKKFRESTAGVYMVPCRRVDSPPPNGMVPQP